MSERVTIDLFAGPGGWSEGARRLGIREVGAVTGLPLTDEAVA